MITGTLKVDSQVLKNTADSFKKKSDSIRTLTTQMIDEVTSMNGAWESDAQQAYCQKFKSLDGDMAQMILMINEHVDDLKEMAAQYEKSEASNASTASALKVDYI